MRMELEVTPLNTNSDVVANKKPKKRKRRDIKDIEGEDDHRKSKKLKKQSQEIKDEADNNEEDIDRVEQLDDQINANNNSDNEDSQENETKEMTHLEGKVLREKLATTDGLLLLRKFVKMCSENKEQNIADEYIASGGNILEILRILSTVDKKNVGNATIVFSATTTLLMKIIANYPQYLSSAEQACRHLINSHISLIHSMMSVQSNAKQRKVALKLLTAIVSLNGNLARELLAHLSLQPHTVDCLLKHTNPSDTTSVRTCFIHFILAFLVEGNVLVIRALLEKHGLLSTIFVGLIYDRKEILELVLGTIKCHILENTGISKTMKLHVFSTRVIKSLICLYNWKGPTNWKKTNDQQASIDKEYLEEKEAVTNVVHNFLIVLLTSHRYGIVFHDYTIGASRTKHNQLVYTVLQSLDRPWEHEKPSDLVVRILTTCPDLIKSQLTFLEAYIDPRLSSKWITLMDFVKKIIDCLDLELCVKNYRTQDSTSVLVNTVMSLIMPPTILKNAVIPSLKHSELPVRNMGIALLVEIFRKVEQFLAVIKVSYGDNSKLFAVSRITEYIMKSAPNLDAILSVWDLVNARVTESDVLEEEKVLEPEKYEHLDAILNLFSIYCKVCPELLDTPSNFEPLKFLANLDFLGTFDTAKLKMIKVKAIEFLLSLDPTLFSATTDIFEQAFSFLVTCLDDKDSSCFSHAISAIRTLLSITGLFELCIDALDIWIYGFTNVTGTSSRVQVSNQLVAAIRKVLQNQEKYINIIVEAELAVSGGTNMSSYKSEDIFTELENSKIRTNLERKGTSNMLRSTSISPLLCYLLRKIERSVTPAVSAYMSYVLIHTLHYQVFPETLLYIVKDAPELSVRKYLRNWLTKNDAVPLKKSLSSMSTASAVSAVLLDNYKPSLKQIFHGDTVIQFKHKDEEITINHSLSPFQVKCLAKMVAFYFARFLEWETLTDSQYETCRDVFVSCLHIAKQFDSVGLVEECARSMLCHPILVTNFSPFSEKENGHITYLVTCIVQDIATAVTQLCDEETVQDLALHLRKKFLIHVLSMLKKNSDVTNTKTHQMMESLIGLLQLTKEDAFCILNKVVELKYEKLCLKRDPNFLVYIVPKILCIVCSDRIKLDRTSLCQLNPEFVKKIWSLLLFLKSKNMTGICEWEIMLAEYLDKYPHMIADINIDNFSSLLKTEISDSTVNLIGLLVERCTKFIPQFMDFIISSDKLKATHIFPVMKRNLSYKWRNSVLKKLYESYRSEIVSYLLDPKSGESFIHGNENAILYLVERTFGVADFEKVFETILQNGDKLEMVPVAYTNILCGLYKKYGELKSEGTKPLEDLIKVLVYILCSTLKKEEKNVEKLCVLCKHVTNTIAQLKEGKSNLILEGLSSSPSWPQFTRFSLKFGLKASKDHKVPILKALNNLCNVAYKNDSNEEYVKTLFEMATSHSEFINTILGTGYAKRDLVEFLWILIQKNKAVMTSAHIPLYLAAYNATLCETDQLLLLILRYYEDNKIDIHEYRPYLWGNAAAVHYSVKGEADTALWRQPTTSQVLNLLEKDIIQNTIRNYPVHRNLTDTDLYESCNTYDPAFYLPLLCSLLLENNVVSCQRVAQSGALALLFASCGSTQSDTRMAAYTALSRYYTHLEALSYKSNLLWMRLIDAFRYGVVSLQSELKDVRLSCIISTFLAQTSLIATQPLHPLYSKLQTFLMARVALDVKTIPELQQLLHSSDIGYREHRSWILDIIRDGTRTEIDVDVAFKCLLFKVLFDFYMSGLSDARAKRLILEVVYAAVRIPKAAAVLVHGHGLLPWLLEVSKNLRADQSRDIYLLLQITNTLLCSVSSAKEQNRCYKVMLLNIVLNVQGNMPRDVAARTLELFIQLFQRMLTFKDIIVNISEENMCNLVDFCKEVVGNVNECTDMLRFGCEYVKIENCAENINEVNAVKNSLQQMVYTWCTNKCR